MFEAILDQCDAVGNKVLTVHSRRAEADVVDAIGGDFSGTVILHWYSGSLRTLDLGVERRFYFSIIPSMAGGKRFLSILSRIPRDRVLLETDVPFVSLNGRPTVLPDVKLVVEQVVEGWALPIDDARSLLFENLSHVLRTSSTTASRLLAGQDVRSLSHILSLTPALRGHLTFDLRACSRCMPVDLHSRARA